MSSENPSDERFIQLEIQLAHALRLYEQLNEVVTEQALRLERQHRSLVKLGDQLKELKEKWEASGEPPPDEKPPHY